MEKYKTESIIHRLTTINIKTALAEIMLGFFGGVLFFSGLAYSFYLFELVEKETESLENSVLIKE